ncbi:MAG: ATP-binding cassette domain-containing protein, partial [Hyphomicrobiaceae bacterium]
MSDREPLLEVRDLRRHFPVRNAFGVTTGAIKALDDVTLAMSPGETLGIVGESGCGKTTLGKTLAGIHKPDAGQIVFDGADISRLRGAARGSITQRLQYIHQDPGNALDPRWKIGRSLDEPLAIHPKRSRSERDRRVRDILAAVGLPPGHLDLYPHEISGGQQRRVGL